MGDLFSPWHKRALSRPVEDPLDVPVRGICVCENLRVWPQRIAILACHFGQP